jgi:hypothetical protein
MSELIPNLDDLREQLPPDSIAKDAHEFVGELEKATTTAEVSSSVDALIDRWLEVSDDPGC